jgi:hypothetical protein
MRITFDVNLNIKVSGRNDDQILDLLKNVLSKLDNMPTKQDFQNAIDEIKSAADNIAADIERLASQAEGGLSAEDATDFVSQLNETATKLRAVADKNPEPSTEEPGGEV